MIPNHSPWIQQLKQTRPVVPLGTDVETDIAVVGGGIAGITTSFFILKNTDKRVTLIEADKVAHGATGHNGGQIVSYFERPLEDLIKEFGFDLAIDGQRSVESAWILLDEIIEEARLQVPMYSFLGHAGIPTFNQLLLHLQDNRHRVNGGLQAESIVVAEEWQSLKNIPEEYKDLYKIVPQKDLMSLLETDNEDYIACLSYKKGCMNSALFSEELAGYLLAEYPDRFSLYEESRVKEVRLKEKSAELMVLGNVVNAERVVLCTNGFENFTISNESGKDIDTKFHHLVAGRIGFMTGYIESGIKQPIAISYFPKENKSNGDPTGDTYIYFTRRPHEHEGQDSYSLICAGGPDKVLPNGALYSRNDIYSEDINQSIIEFLKINYQKYPEQEPEKYFSWHGLMGYTPNGIRRVGPEPVNPTLLYNLGCNGVGLLPSIFGAKRISQFINNNPLPPSIFDPEDQRS